MKTNVKKSFRIFTVFLLAAVLFVGVQMICGNTTAEAANSQNIALTYYKEELKNSELAQKFYRAMEDMAEKGQFKSGKYECNLVESGVLSEGDVAEYVDDALPKVPVALGAARDAFYMDHPDLFYLDVYKLYLSAGMQNGKYVAYLGTGNAENYYADGTLTSESEVNAAIAKYESALDAAVAAAKAGGEDVVSQIKAANKYVAENTEYDYGARADALNNITYDYFVNTAYGSLVNKKALCGGYARAFKAILDRLDIPCVLIQGYSYTGSPANEMSAGYTPHMWNAVYIDGLWYGVDTTWNSTSNNSDKYLLVGDDFLSSDHIADGVISSSGFELKYPGLRALDYGVNEDKNGFSFVDSGAIGDKEFGYISLEDEPERRDLVLGVSYNGMNAAQLEKEGKYYAFRNKLNGIWSMWFSKTAFIRSMGYDETEDAEAIASFYAENYNIERTSYETQAFQFAIFDFLPANGGYIYDSAEITDSHTIAVSVPYINDAYGEYYPAPYVTKITPYAAGYVKTFEPLTVTLKYSEKLVRADENAEIGVEVTGQHDDIYKYIEISNIDWNESENTLSFLFKPSKQFTHNREAYYFVPTNLIGADSRKEPEPGRLAFKIKDVVCSKVFNDGRLYMQVFGDPQFVSADDQSLNNFADKDGKPIVGRQLSQLMLVINETSKSEADKMEETLLGDDSLNIDKADIKASATYQIGLHMCGLVQKVPNDSYMKVGFGFPEGYDADDAGVTFTVYHYKLNSKGEIDGVEEVPCVVTEYGIIATVESFSPFMICAVDSSKVAARKNIFVNADGLGGSVDNLKITTVTEETGSVKYNITPDSGYKVDRVLLNGKEVPCDADGGEITLNYSELAANNELEVSFVSARVATYRAENSFTVKQPKIIVTADDMIVAKAHDESSGKGTNVALIVTIVIICVVVVAAGVCLAIYFVNKNKNGGNNGSNKGKNISKNKNTGVKSTTKGRRMGPANK